MVERFHGVCNATAVRLAEEPLIVANLVGPQPEGSWIGQEA